MTSGHKNLPQGLIIEISDMGLRLGEVLAFTSRRTLSNAQPVPI